MVYGGDEEYLVTKIHFVSEEFPDGKGIDWMHEKDTFSDWLKRRGVSVESEGPFYDDVRTWRRLDGGNGTSYDIKDVSFHYTLPRKNISFSKNGEEKPNRFYRRIIEIAFAPSNLLPPEITTALTKKDYKRASEDSDEFTSNLETKCFKKTLSEFFE